MRDALFKSWNTKRRVRPPPNKMTKMWKPFTATIIRFSKSHEHCSMKWPSLQITVPVTRQKLAVFSGPTPRPQILFSWAFKRMSTYLKQVRLWTKSSKFRMQRFSKSTAAMRKREVTSPTIPPPHPNAIKTSLANAKTSYFKLIRRKHIHPLPCYGSILEEITTAYLKKRESVAPPLPKASKFRTLIL